MKLVDKEYVPEEVVFRLPENFLLPEIIGEVESLEKCQELIGKTFVATSVKYTATRYMDVLEKNSTRKKYQEELEVNQPELEKKLTAAREKYEEAKKVMKSFEDQCEASNLKVKDLAKQVRIGTMPLNLDQSSTWRVPLSGQYFFLTYLHGRLMVADIVDIPEHEKQDLFNSQARNEESISKLQEMIAKAV